MGVGEDVGAGGPHGAGAAIVHVGGGVQPDPGVPVVVVVPAEEDLVERSGVLDGAEPVGEVGPVLEGLELGLGERVVVGAVRPRVGFVTPRSASSIATGFEAIEVPRSAWMVSRSRSTCCLVVVSASSRSASATLSRSAINQPGTYREKMSIATYRW